MRAAQKPGLVIGSVDAGRGRRHKPAIVVQAGDRAVQFHGGFGFTWDCDAQLFLRRALWLQPWFGDAGHHRRALAGLLLDTAAA